MKWLNHNIKKQVMKNSKRIRVKVRNAKRAALADMENALIVGQDMLTEMLNDGLFSSKKLEFHFNEISE